MAADQDFRGRHTDGPVAVVSPSVALSHTGGHALGPENKVKTRRPRRLAPPLLRVGTALLLVSAVTGCDPRLPYVRPQEELVSVPPTIDLASVFPVPGTLAVDVLLGDDCVSENTFTLGSVQDSDLAEGEELVFRWRIVRSFESGTQPQVVSVTLRPNPGPGAGVDVSSTFTIDRQALDAAFGNVSAMVGRTHRIEVRVTDGEFAPSPDSLELADPSMGSAYFYWLFTLDDQPCG